MNSSQSLSSIDVFDLLGVDGDENEKRKIADEMLDAVWDDSIAPEIVDGMSEETSEKVQQVLDDDSMTVALQRDRVLDLLEADIPNLSEMYEEKVLELKKNLFAERVTALKQFYANDSSSLSRVEAAELAMREDRWSDAADILNTLQSQSAH